MNRWTLPDGTFSPPQFASSPQSLILSTINCDESGVYVCTGTRPGTSETVNATITVNVQCKLSETLNDRYALLEVTFTYLFYFLRTSTKSGATTTSVRAMNIKSVTSTAFAASTTATASNETSVGHGIQSILKLKLQEDPAILIVIFVH